MTMTSWPYVAQDVTDIEYGRLYKETAGSDGVVGSVGDNKLQVYADASGMNVKVRSGSAIQRGYMFYSTATETVVIPAASAQTRYDRVVLELDVSNPTIAARITPKVLTGSAGGTTAPALTQTETGIYQISLAVVRVGASVTNIAASDVTDDRYWMDQKVGAWLSNDRRPKSPKKWQLGYNEALGGFEYWNGAAWVNLGAVNLTSSLLTGILPVAKGGTGASNAMAALNSLGIYVQQDQPAYSYLRVWIKVP